MKLALAGIVTALFLAMGTAHAQQITLNLTATAQSPDSCFNFNPNYPNCYGLPVTDVEDGTVGKIWIDNTFLSFLGDYEHLNGKQGLAEVTGVTVGAGTATYTFFGADDDGNPYTGSLTWTFTTHRQCGRGCYTIGEITSGVVAITYR